jgi:hypothetical protein
MQKLTPIQGKLKYSSLQYELECDISLTGAKYEVWLKGRGENKL